ncbi:hypothetical protein BLA18112_04233 [Burkholderia lata]|uniref:Uncharacterized protein n=1 Tax=Burkholderia lata (strain ATCC 17760 / DSM 23089 / LMG 22485 / NCIMB 9086 / R18194 / 383) TaxID=482957 RepID=A0A6P2X8U8_BURL3|nr:hypothetical protein [Burkholderia lata]VWD04669.1 hypothetical protein BLA18112_04233 [Burkholderia lata]
MSNLAGLVKDVHYVDLPDQLPRRSMLPGVNNLVVIRKTRDVVFDIKLNDGATYLLESDGDLFWSVAQGGSVKKSTFKDGEVAYFRVSREFRGDLILRKDGFIVGRYNSREFDECSQRKCSQDPLDKPVPFVVVNRDVGVNVFDGTNGVVSDRGSKSVEDEHPFISVVDASLDVLENSSREIYSFFQKGGDSGTGIVSLDPFGVANRNWLLGIAATTYGNARDNWEWLSECIKRERNGTFRLVQVRLQKMGGRLYFYFSGFRRGDAFFTPGRFGVQNPKIVAIFGAAEMAGAIGTSVRSLVTRNALIAFGFSSATAYAEWTANAKKAGYDLVATLLTNTLKYFLAGVLSGIVRWVIFLVFGLSVAASWSALFVGGVVVVAVSVFATWALEALDKSLTPLITGKEGVILSDVLAPVLKRADGAVASYVSGKRKSSMTDVIKGYIEKADLFYRENIFELQRQLPNDYRLGPAS